MLRRRSRPAKSNVPPWLTATRRPAAAISWTSVFAFESATPTPLLADPSLLQRNIGCRDESRGICDILAKEGLQFAAAHAHRLEAEGGGAITHQRHRKGGLDLGVEPVEDRRRRLRRREQRRVERIDRILLETRFEHRRHVRQRERPLRGADRERRKLVVADEADDGPHGRDAEIDPAG